MKASLPLFLGGALLLGSSSILSAQGSLTPSAGPAPTMKTLVEIEPRTAITSLPFTITETGSYYLGTNVAVTSANTGITVSASNVTIDLNGYSLSGSANSLDGIVVSGSQSVIHIKNGIISGWGGDGIDLSGSSDCIVEDVAIDSNTGLGVLLSTNSVLRHCKISNNTNDGVETVGTGCLILNNEFTDNLRGIDLANGKATVTKNRCFSNTNIGIYVPSDENEVKNNKTIENSVGFQINGSNNHIAENYTIRNGTSAANNQILNAAEANNNQYDLLISAIPETLDRSCRARLTGNVINTTTNGDGIIIDADDVTLDLAGFSIIGSGNSGGSGVLTNSSTISNYIGVGVSSDDGIVVLGSQENITIKNGYVVAWGGDGIYALQADFSTFENIHASHNDGDGIVTDFNCVITKCVANNNGLDGLEGDDGTVITNCSAGNNGDNGIQVSEGCVITNCTSFNNVADGFDVAAGGIITNCSATDNEYHGFDLGLATVCRDSNAYDNGSSVPNSTTPSEPSPVNAGFDLASSCILDNCHSALNNAHGVRALFNSRITNSKFHENDFDGIRVSSTDTLVKNCDVTDNDVAGIQATSAGSMFINNRAGGNVTNYILHSSCSYGPIINVTSSGDMSGVTGADHPYANFTY